MNCHEMDAILFSGGELPPEAREHLATCESCRALAGVMGDDVSYDIDAATLEQARRQIPQDLLPVKPLAPANVFAAGFLVVAAALAAGAASLVGLHGLAVLAPAQELVVFTVLPALLLLAAFALARDMRPGAWTMKGGVVSGLAFGAIELVFVSLFSDYSMGRFVHEGTVCFRFGMAIAIVTAALTWLAVRRGYVVAPISTGATIGALSGLAGLTALELHCPILYVPHLAVWHAGVLVTSIALGAAAGWLGRVKPA